MRKRLPTFCTWKIYTAPTKGDGRKKDEEEIKKGKTEADWKLSECGETAHSEADFCKREQFEECEIALLWSWLTQGDKFTGDLLATWVNRRFPMAPLGWHQWQEASCVKEMVLKSYQRELFPPVLVSTSHTSRTFPVWLNYDQFQPQQACRCCVTIMIGDYFRSRGQRPRWQRSE